MAELEWTKAQRQAFPWAMSAATQGLTQIEGLTQYRAGGGAIRTADWGEVFQTAFQAHGWREDVRSVPLHWSIPERMFVTADVDWETKYVFKAEVDYFNTETNRWESKWISAGFDEPPTHAEWRAEALRRMVEEWTSPPLRDPEEVRFITEEVWQRRSL